MTGRIERRFQVLKEANRAGLVTYLCAGDPDPQTSAELFAGLPGAGADVIEMGMPFTDPMADGPSIQAGSLRALKAGMTLAGTLQMVRGFRRRDDETPVVLMGYFNPIYRYGAARFLDDAKAAGVDGLIVVDLPPEEDDELCLPALAQGPVLCPPGDADHRRAPPAQGAEQHERLPLLRLDDRHHRGRRAGGRPRRPGGRAAARATPLCRSPSASASAPASRPRRSAGSPMPRWWARRWSTGSRPRSTRRAARGRAWLPRCTSRCARSPRACAAPAADPDREFRS